MGDRGRIPIAASLLVVAVTPALLMLSQYRLQASATAFDKGNCRTATREAVSSINILGNRPQPYQIVGYCDLDSGRTQEAVAAMRKAIENQPRSWEYHFGLSIALGYAGADPRPEMAAAARLARREPLVTEGQALLARKTTPAEWLTAAKKLNDDTRVSGAPDAPLRSAPLAGGTAPPVMQQPVTIRLPVRSTPLNFPSGRTSRLYVMLRPDP